jgi:hypothetical protein
LNFGQPEEVKNEVDADLMAQIAAAGQNENLNNPVPVLDEDY